MGKLEVQIMHLGKGHTKGDTVVWLPQQKILFSGDLVENGATPYAGDAYLKEWPATLQALRDLKPRKLVPGRGPACKSPAACEAAIAGTQAFVQALYSNVARGVRQKKDLKQVFDLTAANLRKQYGHWAIFEHCMPFDITRCYDEVSGIYDPRIWTAKRDIQMWRTLQD
jgi:glyoxylase-like metal-dependent hydrolase (beta-lactamase superfamily II)